MFLFTNKYFEYMEKEKEKIINELLAPTPISGDEVKEYAAHLA